MPATRVHAKVGTINTFVHSWNEYKKYGHGFAATATRPTTEDDIRQNAPRLLETVHQLLRTEVRTKLLNQRQTFTLSKLCVTTAQTKICTFGSFVML